MTRLQWETLVREMLVGLTLPMDRLQTIIIDLTRIEADIQWEDDEGIPIIITTEGQIVSDDGAATLADAIARLGAPQGIEVLASPLVFTRRWRVLCATPEQSICYPDEVYDTEAEARRQVDWLDRVTRGGMCGPHTVEEIHGAPQP